jgi:MFS family permease
VRAASSGPRVAAVILPFAAGYFLSYLFRSINAVISPELVAAFSLSAAQLGLLTAAYFLAFGAFQIPLGLLLDRFGPRRTNAALLLVAGLGALLFGLSDRFGVLLLARALIGLGVSGCLMSSIKALSLWFPLEQLPARAGWIFFAGGLGAIAATAPVQAVLAVSDWRTLFMTLACATFGASVAIFLIVPERTGDSVKESVAEQLSGVLRVYTSSRFWQIAGASTLFQAINMALQGLWAAPWLADIAGQNREHVAWSLAALAVATMGGFLFWGILASRLSRRGIAPATVFIAASALFMMVQLLLVLAPDGNPVAIWMAFGFFGTSGSLAFSIVSQSFPRSLTGRATTALNLMVFFAAFAVQWLFGLILDFWPAEQGGYQPAGYRVAFCILLTMQLVPFAWFLWAKRRIHHERPAK